MANYYSALTVFTLYIGLLIEVKMYLENQAKSIRKYINVFLQFLADVLTELISSLHDRKVGGASIQSFQTW